ncbi:choice-of-anchor D domain-containing protein, partial [candidate division WOR-3 bacterium]|nr:choice-of-anchor D domain-containing protein [candidate division WOR-3 bacterium]
DTVKVIVKPKEMPVINVADRLDFKEVQLGETDEEDHTIENKGQATLEVEKVTVDDYHFTIRGRTRFSIPPNDHEKLIVSFKPDAVGPQTGKLTITSNDPEHQIATVELRGSGAGGDKPDLTIYIDDAPSTAHPGQDISGTFKVKVKNQGGADARNFVIDLVLSEDQDVPIEYATYSVNFHDDVLLRGGRTHIDILSPGQTADISAGLYGTIPSDTPTGTYWLGVVVDPGKDVDEIREDNNAGISRLEVVIFAPTQLSPADLKEVVSATGVDEAILTPTQLSPADGSVFSNYPRKTTLEWSAVPGATSYTVEIDCYHCCQSGKWCTDVGKTYKLVPNIKATSYTFNFVGAQPGRWRVWAVDAIGQERPKTGWWEFRYTR